jgi:hypothetical protein
LNASLRSLVAAGHITAGQGRAAAMWAADLDLISPTVGHARAEDMARRRPRAPSGGGDRQQDVMRYAAKRRVRKVEDLLAGRAAIWYRAAYMVARQGYSAAEAASLRGMTMAGFVDVLKIGLVDIAKVYQEGE